MNTKIIFMALFIVCLSMPAMAQMGFPDDGGAEGPADAAPIDALIYLGLGAGALYGTIKRVKK